MWVCCTLCWMLACHDMHYLLKEQYNDCNVHVICSRGRLQHWLSMVKDATDAMPLKNSQPWVFHKAMLLFFLLCTPDIMPIAIIVLFFW